MDNFLTVTGIVLSSMAVGDYDKRIVLLTKEMGKISAFAKGAKRPNSAFSAGSRPFAFGRFSLFPGKNSYTVRQMQIQNYFEEVITDLESNLMGSYFLEFADYYTREGGDEAEVLILLYQALRALKKEAFSLDFVRAVYELKLMILNGDFSEEFIKESNDIVAYTISFIADTRSAKLFTFTIKPEVLSELKCISTICRHRYIDREFKSLKIIEQMKLM